MLQGKGDDIRTIRGAVIIQGGGVGGHCWRRDQERVMKAQHLGMGKVTVTVHNFTTLIYFVKLMHCFDASSHQVKSIKT